MAKAENKPTAWRIASTDGYMGTREQVTAKLRSAPDVPKEIIESIIAIITRRSGDSTGVKVDAHGSFLGGDHIHLSIVPLNIATAGGS